MTRKTDEAKLPSSASDELQSPARRKLLSAGAKSMPAILTLQSGAAMAQGSFMIEAASMYATDGLGRTLCVDESSVYPADLEGLLWDCGDPPKLTVNIIPSSAEKQFYLTNNKSNPVDPWDMCLDGGTFWYKPDTGGTFVSKSMNKGFVATGGALYSMHTKGVVTEYLM